MSGRRRRARPEPPLVINGIADAVSLAMGLADRFRRGHGVAVTDSSGRVLDILVFTREQHTAEDAIQAGLDVRARHSRARRMLLVSALHDVDIQTPSELEVEMWRATVDRCELAGLDLWEWILTSNEVMRSLATTARTESAWRSPG